MLAAERQQHTVLRAGRQALRAAAAAPEGQLRHRIDETFSLTGLALDNVLRCFQAKFFIATVRLTRSSSSNIRLQGSVYAAVIALDLFLRLYGWCDRPRDLVSSGPR